MPVIAVNDLKLGCSRVFQGAGLSEGEATRVAHSLVLSNLMGHDSHGVIRVVQYVDALKAGRVQPGKTVQVVREADSSVVLDGEWGFGQTLCHQAMELTLEKARARSVGVAELFNCSHIGRLGEYVESAAEEGMIGIVMCNNHGGGRLQPPFGGMDSRMSPNPVAVGIPTGGEFPIVVDMTTSVVAEGKIRMKRNLGEDIPEGWAIDSSGNPATDPGVFYGPPRGSILPFGGITAHKGYALAIVVDILSGALGGGGCSKEEGVSGGNGVFLMAFDIGAFTGRDRFEEEIGEFIEYLKGSRLLPGFEEILMPGEMEARMRRQKEAEGVFVDDETWRQIRETSEKVGVQFS